MSLPDEGLKLLSVPDKRITVSISHLVAIGALFVSMSIGYGAYKTRFEDQTVKQMSQQTKLEELTQSINRLNVEVVRLGDKLEAETEARRAMTFAVQQQHNAPVQ